MTGVRFADVQARPAEFLDPVQLECLFADGACRPVLVRMLPWGE